jgi:hypothetical protein
MKEISYRLRGALITAISPLTYLGTVIPIFDTRVNPSATLPTIGGGTTYVLINSQTNTETTNDKCQTRLDANISFDVVTRFPNGVGGNLNAEKIGELIMSDINRSLVIPDFDLLNVTMNFNQNLPEFGVSQDAYRKLISYRFDVFEK